MAQDGQNGKEEMNTLNTMKQSRSMIQGNKMNRLLANTVH
jgi:hypothetical protein